MSRAVKNEMLWVFEGAPHSHVKTVFTLKITYVRKSKRFLKMGADAKNKPSSCCHSVAKPVRSYAFVTISPTHANSVKACFTDHSASTFNNRWVSVFTHYEVSSDIERMARP